MKILSLSDTVVDMIYSPAVREKFHDVDMVLDCGDTPYYYLEYVVCMLNKPTFFVRGNHSKVMEYDSTEPRAHAHGAKDLHCRNVYCKGLLLAGVEGSLRYHPGPFQYTQREMWMKVFSLLPGLFRNRILRGRFIDVFVTHASPWGIHDQPDLTHQGIKAFRWFIQVFQPAFHFHGHIHVYRPDTVMATMVGKTRVINTFGYRVTETYFPHETSPAEQDRPA
jgi:uncharacterized protein